jgi:hypothetical protein
MWLLSPCRRRPNPQWHALLHQHLPPGRRNLLRNSNKKKRKKKVKAKEAKG